MQCSDVSTKSMTPAAGTLANLPTAPCSYSQRTVWLALAFLCLAAASAPAFNYGQNPNAALGLDSYQAGQSPAHRLRFDVASGELETYRVVVTYPDGFRFNGFDALGPIHTHVGAYELDVNADGAPERTVPLRSLTPHSAYADVIADGRFSPDLEPVLRQAGGTEFHLRLPFGGDANPDTLVAPFGARLSLVLFPGLLANPDVGGVYTFSGELTSVDPDTDGVNDGANDAPLTFAVALPVQIEGPAACDMNADGNVDRHDIDTLNAVRNTPAAPGDPRDVNDDGTINVLDARICVLQCTRPRCATR
jgi:hypothetical protein